MPRQTPFESGWEKPASPVFVPQATKPLLRTESRVDCPEETREVEARRMNKTIFFTAYLLRAENRARSKSGRRASGSARGRPREFPPPEPWARGGPSPAWFFRQAGPTPRRARPASGSGWHRRSATSRGHSSASWRGRARRCEGRSARDIQVDKSHPRFFAARSL